MHYIVAASSPSHSSPLPPPPSSSAATVPTDEEFDTLVDRFARYDSNGDGSITLNHQEEKEFHNDIYQFTSCNHFVDHISEVIDIDGSNSITESEWIKFFNDDHTKGE